ncbi:MAG: hypothetical protein LBH32_13135 [Dysgonamonadaceae bacterium]|jgi:hypothetical protein|nr:hypothetical protein [Dysgonamonadaceae bacterium]
MKNSDIKILIDKYFEGLTSLKEEQKLRDYFRRKNVSPELGMYVPMFQYFASERKAMEKPAIKVKKVLLRRSSFAAAACLLLLIGLRLFFNNSGKFSEISQAYIDGKKYTDIELIQAETLKSLENLSEGSDDAYSSQIEALENLF